MLIKILAVDDSATDRLIIKSMLSKYFVLTASDGHEAMRMLEEHEGINLLILDLNMPRMDGFEVLEALKKDKRYDRLRTIILTNYDELDNEIKGLRLGAVDYIRKPIQMDSLRARIDIHIALLRAEQALEQRLGEQALTFEMILDQAPIGIVILHDCDPGRPGEGDMRVNAKYEQILGRTKEEIIRLGWESITHPDDLREERRNLEKLRSGEIKMYSMEKRYVRPDGSTVWVYKIIAPITTQDGIRCGHICLIQDITERKMMEKALNESERIKSVLLSHLPGLAYRCKYDPEWTMQYVSKGCYALTGYQPESLLHNRDLSFKDLISPEYREVLSKEWERILAARLPFKHEYEIITATGEKKWVLELGQGIFSDDGEVEALEGIVLDISERKAIENTLKYNNEHDRWTGLYNRDYLTALLEKDAVLKKHSKKALIGINLSMVQVLTANYGYQYSQNLIKKAAEVLSRYCSENCILFQPSEHRFIFYLFDFMDRKQLEEFGCLIADTLGNLFAMERIGGGIGILEIEPGQNRLDIELLLRRLLIATEKSVSMFGKDFEICFYNEELEAMVNRERDIVRTLSAIAANEDTDNALFLQYQPIMNTRTDTLFGFEALARLKTETLGLVSPLEFIPLAEKTKLILPIGEKVIIQAFRFLNRLKELGYGDVGVSINISVIQLLNPDFPGRLLELISQMQVDQRNVGIEITESVFTSDYDGVNKSLKVLRDAGLYIAIDDFGTGHSSLAREKGLTVDCMKIDKYFVDRLLSTDQSQAITGDIISIAHKLGHFTIAEGVECESQLQYLLKHNCDKVQGYLISEPLHEEAAIRFLKDRR
jgi:PAS domain S-box-containing protein